MYVCMYVWCIMSCISIREKERKRKEKEKKKEKMMNVTLWMNFGKLQTSSSIRRAPALTRRAQGRGE